MNQHHKLQRLKQLWLVRLNAFKQRLDAIQLRITVEQEKYDMLVQYRDSLSKPATQMSALALKQSRYLMNKMDHAISEQDKLLQNLYNEKTYVTSGYLQQKKQCEKLDNLIYCRKRKAKQISDKKTSDDLMIVLGNKLAGQNG